MTDSAPTWKQTRPLVAQVADDLEEIVYILWCEREKRKLVCVECGTTAVAGAWGWRMYLTIDDELASYCGDCAQREFG